MCDQRLGRLAQQDADAVAASDIVIGKSVGRLAGEPLDGLEAERRNFAILGFVDQRGRVGRRVGVFVAGVQRNVVVARCRPRECPVDLFIRFRMLSINCRGALLE